MILFLNCGEGLNESFGDIRDWVKPNVDYTFCHLLYRSWVTN